MRYSAKLLFQYKVFVKGVAGKRRLCEERIVVLQASSAQSALRKAKLKGRKGEQTYANNDGNPVHFEFIGVLQLLELGVECEDDEVWYETAERLLPSERREKLLPPESELNAIWNELRRTRD